MSDEHLLRDEIEQLRTALENALEENERANDDRDRLLQRVTTLSRDLQAAHAAFAGTPAASAKTETAEKCLDETEELRVAFEEMQVLTEELEASNGSLHEANCALDRRVEERTVELRHANNALRAAEASLRALAHLVPDLLWRADARGNVRWFNQRWFDYTGQDERAALGAGWLDAVHPVDRLKAQQGWEAAAQAGTPYEVEVRIRSADGEFRWFIVRAAQEPREGKEDRPEWFGASTDIHDQRLIMDALTQSEQRFRTLVEGMSPLAWRAVDGGKWTWCSPQWCETTGQRVEETPGDGWLNAFHPEDRDAAREAWKQAAHLGVLEIEGRILHRAERRHHHYRTRALPVRDERGFVREWLGTSTNIDDLVRLQHQHEVLIAELQHRTRNVMGVVQAMVMRTIRTSASLDDFRGRVEDRLSALTRVQGLLSRRESLERIAFDTLLREELSAHVDLTENHTGQIVLSGPPNVWLRSATVQTFALALHELATNAVKYGALAQPDASLAVRWTLSDEDDGRMLHVDWRESGVSGMPAANAPARGGGYGRELIERALPYQMGARSSYALTANGVHCTIMVPVPAGRSRTGVVGD